MTTYTWPDTRDAAPRSAQWRVVDNLQRTSESPLSGYTQTISMPGARWGWSLEFGDHRSDLRQEVEAFLLRLSGREHRVALWDFKRRVPRGTCNLSGVTLGAAAAQFATSLQLAGCGANKTLVAGDWIGLATGQLVRVVANATADAGGAMTVEVRHMLRTAAASGSAVTLDRPTALYVRTASGLDMPRGPGRHEPGFAVDFVEVFA